MLAPAASFRDAILAIHILAVVVAFGVTFAYPIFDAVGARMDRRAIPWFHRMQGVLSRRVIGPGLVVVLIAGVYLASHEHQWRSFYVQRGIGAVIVLGALQGSIMIPRQRKLAELAARDVQAAGAGEVSWSPE